MNDLEIYKTHVDVSVSYFKKSIYGLNIFRANKVIVPKESNPQAEFLRGICSQNTVSANIGNLYDYADSPEELFETTGYSKEYSTVRIGCYGGEFYDSKQWPSFPPLFFASVSADFVDIMNRGESLIQKILLVDAIALFVSPIDNTSTNKLQDLLGSPFVSTDDFLTKATRFYKLVSLSQADGDYFTFFSKDEIDFAMLDGPLDKAVELIQNAEWYQDNSTSLKWDDEYSMCLVKE